ncbi:MAG TPA: PaaI family thioesterase [Polyangiaceae bacterium]
MYSGEVSPGELLQFLSTAFPRLDVSPFTVERVEPARLVLRFRVGEEHLRPGGTVSGPTLMTLADTATYLLLVAREGALAADGTPSAAARSVTTSLTMHFLRRPKHGDVVAEARLLKGGKRLSIVEVFLRPVGSEDPVAHATVTYASP